VSAFKHVLVPLNFESVPRTVLTTAAVLATEQGADLTLLHVSDAGVDFALAGFTAVLDEHVKQHYDLVRHAMDDAWSIAAEFGATANIHIAKGHPVHAAIRNVAASLKADPFS
jgi:hypothetical protein